VGSSQGTWLGGVERASGLQQSGFLELLSAGVPHQQRHDCRRPLLTRLEVIVGYVSPSIPASECVGESFEKICGDHLLAPFILGDHPVIRCAANAERAGNGGAWLAACVHPPR
jgi:hypothetical protein